MAKIYFTDNGAGLSDKLVTELGVVRIDMPIIYKGKEVWPCDGLDWEVEYMQTSAVTLERYKEVMQSYVGNELIYISYSHKVKASNVFIDSLRATNIPNLTIIDSGFVAHGQIEVIKRVVQGKPFEDIRYFFVTRHSIKNGTVGDMWHLFTFKDGKPELIKRYQTRFAAVARLKKCVNSQLYTCKDLLVDMWQYMGKDYVGGIYSD